MMEKIVKLKQALSLVDNWIKYQMYINEIHGTAIGIFVEDELIFDRVYGYADFENKIKLSKKHLFRIASQSKLFTATAIMQLVSENKLSIEDKVSKHLTWFKSAKDENLQDITLKHLLTHSSGIQCDDRSGFWSNHKPLNIDDIKLLVKEGISVFKAGEVLKYSNLGFAILGLIIESVTGKTFEEYVQKSILDPLEMNETLMDFSEDSREIHATGYKAKFPKKNREREEHFPSGILKPAGGMSSTVKDVMKFFQAHIYANPTLLSEDQQREMQKVQFEYNNEKRGLGFWIGQVPNGPSIVYHLGGYKGFNSCSALYQEDKTIIVILTNAYDGPAVNWLMAIRSILDLYTNYWDEFIVEGIKEKQDFSELEGYYQTSGDISYFTQIGDKLVSILPSNSNPLQTLVDYEYKGDMIFLCPREGPFAKIGEKISFTQGEDGNFILLESDNTKAYRFNFDQ